MELTLGVLEIFFLLQQKKKAPIRGAFLKSVRRRMIYRRHFETNQPPAIPITPSFVWHARPTAAAKVQWSRPSDAAIGTIEVNYVDVPRLVAASDDGASSITSTGKGPIPAKNQIWKIESSGRGVPLEAEPRPTCASMCR